MQVGLYARVSTHDQQTLVLQREAMEAYVQQRAWQVVRALSDRKPPSLLISKS